LDSQRPEEFTTHGTYGDICVAMAVTDRAAGHRGFRVILEKGMTGFHPGRRKTAWIACQRHVTVVFDDCRVPKENLLGEPGED